MLGPRCSLLIISSVMLGNYLQQTTSADDITYLDAIFFLALRVNRLLAIYKIATHACLKAVLPAFQIRVGS